jgi:hypothetical protein
MSKFIYSLNVKIEVIALVFSVCLLPLHRLVNRSYYPNAKSFISINTSLILMEIHSHFRSRSKTKPKFTRVTREERFDLAFFIALGIFALFFLLVFIPAIGPILIITLVPYIAGYQSGKFINKNDGLLIAVIVGIIWTIIEMMIFFSILGQMNLAIISPGFYTGLDWLFLFILLSANIVFCALGSRYSPRNFDDAT